MIKPSSSPRVGGHTLDWRPFDKGTRASSPAWIDYQSGLVCVDGKAGSISRSPKISQLLSALPPNVDRVYLVGELPGKTPNSFAQWLCDSLPDHFVAGNHLLTGERPIGHYKDDSGRRISVRAGSAWMTDGDVRPEHASISWMLVTEALQHRFRGVELASTPGETGRRLLQNSWPYQSGRYKGSPGWDDLPADQQALIRDNTTQSRREFLALPHVNPKHVIEVDKRFAYAAYTREIASAPSIWTDEPASAVDFDRGGRLAFQPGLYHIRFRVPDNWNHIGLFPVKEARRYIWPSEPGYEGEAWVDIEEIKAARFNATGIAWDFQVLESLQFTQRQGQGRNGPLYQWGKWLIEAEEQLRKAGNELAALMVRNIVRHTIGWLGPKPRKIEKSVPLSEALKAPLIIDIDIVGDDLVWHEDAELFSPEWSHPEWQRQVWAKCRAGITRFALSLPREHIVAIDTDAIFVTEMPTLKGDPSKAGQFRRKNIYIDPSPFSDDKSFRRAING